MNVKRFLSACILLLLTSVPVKADVWTLERTVMTAVKTSNQVNVEKLNADLADLDAMSAEMRWRPHVSFTSRAIVMSEVMELDMPLKTVRFGDYDSYDFLVQFNQIIYDGGRLKSLREVSLKR